MNTEMLSNPFPRDPVVTTSIEQLPDFRETDSYRQAISIVENFRENFSLSSSAGMAMGIRGRFGSGKTHLVLQLMAELQNSSILQSKVIYAKADKVDPLDLYVNHFARRLKADDLKNVVSLHLAKLLRVKATPPTTEQPRMITIGDWEKKKLSGEGTPTQDSERTLTQIAQDEVAKLVASDPQNILKLIEQELLPISGLNRDFDQEIETTARDLGPDFFSAYSKVTDPELGTIAARWIQGEQLTNSERLDLGLTSAGIMQASDAKQALRFLLGAFKKADFAVLFCLDEFERFSSRGTADDLNASAGLLKDLAETFKDTGHLLVVSGASDAWRLMKKDVFDRIKQTDIVEMRLSEDEAEGLLDAYCQVSYGSAASVFEGEALRLCYEAGAQNTRRVLNLAHHAYEIATSSGNETDPTNGLPIQVRHLEQAANELLSDSKRQDSVAHMVEEISLDLGLPISKEFELDSFRCDYILGDPQRPQVAIEITKSIFKLGEVAAAREIAKASQEVRTRFPQTRFCVLIVGYSTPQVRQELAKVVDRVFSFDEDSFPSEFREFLKTTAFQPADVLKTIKSQESAYQDLLRKFDQLEGTRREEIEQLKRAFDDLQSGSLTAREAARETRVTDKMVVTLRELTTLMEAEEALAFRVMSTEEKERKFIEPREKLERVLRLIDEQRTYIRRADVLNERLSQAQEFQLILRKLTDLIQSAEERWDESFAMVRDPVHGMFLDDAFNRLEIRRVYRERKDLLSELENLHTNRAARQARAVVRRIGDILGELEGAMGGIAWRTLERLRRINLKVALLWILALAGLLVILYNFVLAFAHENRVFTNYSRTLSSIQERMVILEKDPAKAYPDPSVSSQSDADARSYFVPQLEEYLQALNTSSSDQATYTWQYAYSRIDDVRESLATLISTLKEAQPPKREVISAAGQPSLSIRPSPSASIPPSPSPSVQPSPGPSIRPSPTNEPTPTAVASDYPGLTSLQTEKLRQLASTVKERCRLAQMVFDTDSTSISDFVRPYWSAHPVMLSAGIVTLVLAVGLPFSSVMRRKAKASVE